MLIIVRRRIRSRFLSFTPPLISSFLLAIHQHHSWHIRRSHHHHYLCCFPNNHLFWIHSLLTLHFICHQWMLRLRGLGISTFEKLVFRNPIVSFLPNLARDAAVAGSALVADHIFWEPLLHLLSRVGLTVEKSTIVLLLIPSTYCIIVDLC